MYRIIGPASASREAVWAALADPARNVTPLFLEQMFPVLWVVAEDYGIDPVGVVAQSGKETGWGRFAGLVRPAFHNTCALKLAEDQQAMFPGITDGDRPLAHAIFPSWWVGAEAHVQHLRAYAGWPVSSTIVDPRYELALSRTPDRWVEQFSGLGGRWAPSTTYGTQIETIMDEIGRR